MPATQKMIAIGIHAYFKQGCDLGAIARPHNKKNKVRAIKKWAECISNRMKDIQSAMSIIADCKIKIHDFFADTNEVHFWVTEEDYEKMKARGIFKNYILTRDLSLEGEE